MSSYSDDLFTFLATARSAASMQELDSRFATLIGRWGFDNWSAAPIGAPSLSPIRPFQIVFGRPTREWSVRYREENYVRHDAALRALLQSNEAIWWSSFSRSARLSGDERRLFDESRALGVGDGLSAPIRLANQSVWVCAFTGAHPEAHWEVADAARFAAERYVLKALELREPDLAKTLAAPVTPAQMEIVRMLARGLNLKQAAHALKLSPSTVYNQIASAKHRMSVKTVPELLRRITQSGEL